MGTGCQTLHDTSECNKSKNITYLWLKKMMKISFNKKNFCVRMGNEVHRDEQYHLAKN